MILHRLRVERFRAHNLPVEIVFNDRLTVVSGLNEAGKSTLFTALQYAFFRRSSAKGKDIDSLAPWDTLGLSTGVTVEFSHGTHDYRLEKVWGQARRYDALAPYGIRRVRAVHGNGRG